MNTSKFKSGDTVRINDLSSRFHGRYGTVVHDRGKDYTVETVERSGHRFCLAYRESDLSLVKDAATKYGVRKS